MKKGLSSSTLTVLIYTVQLSIESRYCLTPYHSYSSFRFERISSYPARRPNSNADDGGQADVSNIVIFKKRCQCLIRPKPDGTPSPKTGESARSANQEIGDRDGATKF